MEVPAETQERIHNAIERYRQQMLSSNRRYLADCIRHVESLGLRPKKRVAKLGRGLHLIRITDWFIGLRELPSPEAVISGEEDIEKSTTICRFTQIWPAVAEEVQRECIEALAEHVNAALDPNGEITRVELPIDFIAMIKETDGIRNPDLIEWGDVGIRGTSSWKGPYTYFPLHANLQDLLHLHLCFRSPKLKILTGWAIDETESVDEVYTRSYFAYCRHTDEPTAGKRGEWGWRILLWRDIEGNGEGGLLVFESLEEYLDTISCWYDLVQRDFKAEAAKQINHPRYNQGLDP
ncbi:hypothetical protein BP6252_05239 [Coleophoma cylindrospora]|uniref:Uncharacterized protein n=1 Tax=Coleophoma cylindrospora TaxID=1849047 RepID=A0A3D8RTA7_9HELO|nr:hypothetical protein BP6252_05239 [Coleophoma cylindrospora]